MSSAKLRPSQVHGSRSSSSQQCAHTARTEALLLCRQGEVSAHPACLARCVCAVDDKEIDTAKMQVQGQLAAQYIQDVMQVRPGPPPQRRSPRSARAMCTRSCTLPARRHCSETGRPHSLLPGRLPTHTTSSLHCAESDRQVLREVRDATWRQARRLGEGARSLRLAPSPPPPSPPPPSSHTSPPPAHLRPHTHGEPRQRAIAHCASAHQVCLAKCMDRYLDAMALVSQTWAARAKQQAMAGQPGLGGPGFQ